MHCVMQASQAGCVCALHLFVTYSSTLNDCILHLGCGHRLGWTTCASNDRAVIRFLPLGQLQRQYVWAAQAGGSDSSFGRCSQGFCHVIKKQDLPMHPIKVKSPLVGGQGSLSRSCKCHWLIWLYYYFISRTVCEVDLRA